MESCSIPRPPFPFSPSSSSIQPKKLTNYKTLTPYPNPSRILHFTPLSATLNSPKGSGSRKTPKRTKKPRKLYPKNEEQVEKEEEEEDERAVGIIPEIVTNRMINRMGLSVGIPLFVGLLFFPFFYYLKVVLKIDVPTWIPFIVSFIFFGTALLGVSYGIVSASWDPMREGSLLGWNEAQKNWPVFWKSLRGGGSGKKTQVINVHLRYATHQKRSDSKRALESLISSFNSNKISFEDKFRLDEDEANDSDMERKKDQSKRHIRSHYKKMKRKLKKKKFDDGFDDDSGRTFQAVFGNKWYTWSFKKQGEESHFQDSTTGFEWRENSNRTYNRNDKWANESDAESDNESCSYVVGSSSDRTLLGLPPSGPLKVEDVKNAFRLSALKWHPDKHQGSGQSAVAEEKFKCCVTAYKSLCNAFSSA